jgi:hypothetical protein
VSSLAMGGIVLGCIFGGALFGMLLRKILPEDHLSQDSKDVVKLGMGLIATMAALLLGLLIATAKGAFDTQNNELKQGAAKILLLDRALAHYGPETQAARDVIRRAIAFRLAVTWPEDASTPVRLDTPETTPTVEAVESGVLALSPKTDGQQWLRSRALQLLGDLQQTRWLLFGGTGDPIPRPFLVVVVLWISVIFASFGLFAPPNGTVVSVLFVCALSVATAIVLILELSQPFEGFLKISSAPLRYTLAHLGQ